MPHAKYGVDLAKVPDTYIEPFTAYRAWNWTSEGITSLNGALWTPKIAFEAVCSQHPPYEHDHGLEGGVCTVSEHLVPDPDCTCGMYAGINMQHLIDINYIERGIHGEVALWGRLMRHTLGWRAQIAYPKYFVVPMNMVPHNMNEAQERLKILVEYDVDIYLQPDTTAKLGGETIPLWVRDYGYSQQGLSVLLEKRSKWYQEHPKAHQLAVGDRVAVFGNGGGIGIVKEVCGNDMFYTLFSPDMVYRKTVKSVVWNDQNWRWETTGLGAVRRVAKT